MRFGTYFIFILLITISSALAGEIRGVVQTEEGEPLPFATIFVKETGSGTITDDKGIFILTLPNGTYTIVFQYQGFQSETRQIELTDTPTSLIITLKPQTILMNEVIVRASKEDPAYTIMRKAIAKASYHTNQLDSFSAKVYIKGSGQIKDYPWIVKRALEKAGIKKNRIFVTESVSEITFKRPNTFIEKVISVRTDGIDSSASPNLFIYGSFYNPEIAEAVSPLSPQALAYYRFEYMGTFLDQGHSVSKIKVIPRVKGEDVFEGTIQIVEDLWCIYSVNLLLRKYPVTIQVNQVYAPLRENVWLPVSQQFDITGRALGFEGEYKYLATISGYTLQLNPDLIVPEIEIIDEKLESEKAKTVARAFRNSDLDVIERLDSSAEISRKELRTLLKAYENQERREQEEPEIIGNRWFSIDSTAFNRGSTYWEQIRPVPLTQGELEGYRVADSLSAARRLKAQGDSVQSRSKGFQPYDILLGDNYRLAPGTNFRIEMPRPNFNTVEGFNLSYHLAFGKFFRDSTRIRSLTISPVFRYGFSNRQFMSKLSIYVQNNRMRLSLEGGRYIQQFNPENPIHPVVNSLTTLLLEQNFMKIYERDYLQVRFLKTVSSFVTVNSTVTWEDRRAMVNTTAYKLIDRPAIDSYTLNDPVNISLSDTRFPNHQALTGSIRLTARPWQRYRTWNGRRLPIPNSSPTLTLDYHTGISGILGSDISYNRLEAGFHHYIRFGFKGTLGIHLQGGKFITADSLSFIDYKHFAGNLTPIMTTDPVSGFRLLDYYRFSTATHYVTGNVHYQFRRLLISNITVLRLAGIRENIFATHLYTPAGGNYDEVGYSIDGLLRLFRLEFASWFEEGSYKGNGFRIGIAASLASQFGD